MTKAEQEKSGLKGGDKQQGDLQDAGGIKTPEGLQRERKGPLDKDVGRADTGYKSSSQDKNGEPSNPPKSEQAGEQKKQPGQQY